MIDRCYIEITNVCNLNCDFCPKHTRTSRRLTLEEFDLLTDRIRDRVVFLYFHLMGEPFLHPLLPEFIKMAREKGFRTVLTSNGTQMYRGMELLSALPHKIQLSLHSHESNDSGNLAGYMDEVMKFSLSAAEQGTCVVLRLWNQGGREDENDEVMRLIGNYVPQPWKERPDGYRVTENIYLEFDRKFEWPEKKPEETERKVFCKALKKQIGVLADGSVVPCCLDHNGDVVLGNLFQQTLDEVLDSPRAKAMVEGFEHHIATEPLCMGCESGGISVSFRGHVKGESV